MTRLAMLLWVLLIAGCGATASPAGGGADCRSDDLPACERALIAADARTAAAWVAAYAEARDDAGWRGLWQALGQPGVVWIGERAPEGVAALPLPADPESVPLETLLLAVARHRPATPLFLARGPRLTQLYPNDPLSPELLGLPAHAASDRARWQDDRDLAAGVDAMIAAARRFAYAEAATHAEKVRAMLSGRGRDDEPAMRARFALGLLDSAGIALAEPGAGGGPAAEGDAGSGETPPDFAAGSSAYADLLAVMLSRPDSARAWRSRRTRITAGLEPERVAVLDAVYGGDASCAPTRVPPMERPGDLTLLHLLPGALDVTGIPGEAPPAGKLGVRRWLGLYDRAVQLVDQSHGAWLHIGTLLAQRGELYGLSAAGSQTYKRVSALAAQHVAALDQLATAHPTRFQTLGVVGLVFQPGVLSDPPLREAITQLSQRSVALQIEAADDVSALWEAAIAAFAVGMSYPPALQGAHFGALRQSLSHKLGGAFGARGGWGVAGLRASGAVLGLLLGQKDALGSEASRIHADLARDGVPQPGLAKLVAAAALYAELGSAGELMPEVSNPNMYTPRRRNAREALGAALAELAPGGPTSQPDKELLGHTVDLADAAIPALVAHYSHSDDAPRCEGQSAIGPKHALRDAFDRVHKKRRTLLAHPAFARGAGDDAWRARARLVALVLSDALDLVDQKSGALRYAVAEADAQRIVKRATAGWTDDPWGEVIGSSYLLLRGAFSDDAPAPSHVTANALSALEGLSRLFGDGGGGLFDALADIGRDVTGDSRDLAALLTGQARRAYADGKTDRGDLLMMMVLTVAIVREEATAPEAIALAQQHDRPVRVPLLLHGEANKDRGDPAGLGEAMRAAVAAGCNAPDPEAVLAVRQAVHDFRRGERDKALAALGRVLKTAESRGLAVPRQIFRYEQQSGQKTFNAEQSHSYGSNLLVGSGSFQVGLGYQTGGRQGGRMLVRFSPEDAGARSEAARYYAHASLLAASYHFAAGHDQQAVTFARRGIATYARGVLLGRSRVPPDGDPSAWTGDAAGVLAILAQQAADAGHPFLAGDLWTLAKSALDETSGDAQIDALLDPLPLALRDVAEIEAIQPRAARALELVAAKLPCTGARGDPAAFERNDCQRYPSALGLRIADALPSLPRLKTGAEVGKPACSAWRPLDTFLAAADSGLYEPAQFMDALDALRAAHPSSAATLLARHRHPNHCSPEILAAARALAARPELDDHLRADLLSVAANCTSDDREIAADLTLLDDVTQRHADPTRNFEVLLFAVRHALTKGQWRPLYQISHKPGFVKRWYELGPEIAAAALLIHHAAALGADEKLAAETTAPFHRLLCTTFPAEGQHGALCHTVTLLESDKPLAEKKRAASEALAKFLQSMMKQP